MIYDMLAPFYDAFMGDVDYSAWAHFVDECVNRYMKNKPSPALALDIGCGTGSSTFALANIGYDMTGVDYSPEMLNVARERAERLSPKHEILWLCQNMTELELYGTVDLAASSLDGINHLLTQYELNRCLSLVHNYLIPDGIFVFDVNTKAKFENIFADKSYVYEDEDAFCVWQNFYNKKNKICDFYISLFIRERDGRYIRFDEEQRERMYTLKSLKSALIKSGFEFIGAFSDFDFTPGTDNDERLYIVARCIKN